MSKQAVFTLKKSKRQNFETFNSLRLVIDWTNLREPIGPIAETVHAVCAMITIPTRNSAIADKPRNAFRGQSRLPNMVPCHMLGMVSY